MQCNRAVWGTARERVSTCRVHYAFIVQSRGVHQTGGRYQYCAPDAAIISAGFRQATRCSRVVWVWVWDSRLAAVAEWGLVLVMERQRVSACGAGAPCWMHSRLDYTTTAWQMTSAWLSKRQPIVWQQNSLTIVC
jgi:uncharacterized membrane protein